MHQRLDHFDVARIFAREGLRFLFSFGGPMSAPHMPARSCDVPADFLGIAVAPCDDPAGDEYTIERLRELGVSCVRVDLSYAEPSAPVHRFLDRLLQDRFKVCLHLVQPREEAARMDTDEAQARWRRFIRDTLDRYGDRSEMVEIGSTCNRRTWAGYRPATFLAAWTIAREEIVRRRLQLAGPNVTDFEPFYNVGFLGAMAETGALPQIHSDNLFVERATQPEAFDHKVLGRLLKAWGKFNLVKKATVLHRISTEYGLEKTICSHVAWSLRRINRVLTDVEEKQADYLARYACLAAASGSLHRVYWGPLIGQREGLIDDGTSEYPVIPHATFYGRVPGVAGRFRVRPAFHAFRTCVRFLAGSRFIRSLASAQGLELHEFTRDDQLVHVVWTTDGNIAPAADVYDLRDLSAATAYSRDGARRHEAPTAFTESPLYLTWPNTLQPRVRPGCGIVPAVGVSPQPGVTFRPVRAGKWQGLLASYGDDASPDASPLLPENLDRAPDRTVMRDGRNRVWSMPDPRHPSRTIVVKWLRVRKWHRKLLQRRKPSRARRCWNGAHGLLRRGIPTPRPIAFFEPIPPAPPWDSYFIYDMFQTPHSIRQAFTAFAAGEKTFLGIASSALYEALSDFLHDMHSRGVFFRDLSAGNVLLRARDDGTPEFCLIDTSRARFHTHPVPLLLRLSDLKRIAHPLDWKCREEFLPLYLRRLNRRLTWWMRIPFRLYDLKHAIRRSVRRRA